MDGGAGSTSGAVGNKKKGKKKGKKGGGTAATPSLRDCANCAASEGSIPGIPIHNACARCEMTFYCGPKCQKQHWKTGGHKQSCVSKEDRRVQNKSSGSSGGGSGAAAEEEECAICLMPLSRTPWQALPCSHSYHTACVEKLQSLGINQVCPLCRADLPPGPEKEPHAFHSFVRS